MADDPSYILDIDGLKPQEGDGPAGPSLQGRKWIGVNFECCGVYTRIYKNAEGTAYVGNCPKCARQVKVRVGEGGTSHRIFRAS